MANEIRRDKALADPWLWVACIVYAASFFALAVVRYSVHRNFVDLGLFAQVTASAFGCFCSPLYGSQWAHHFSPILYVVGVFMQMYRSALTLAALQAVAGALFIPAVYGIVFRRTDRATARLAAAVALLYPPLAGMIFGDFYENGFAPAAVAWLFWAFDCENVIGIFVFAVLALAVKEDQAFFLFVAGVLGFARYRTSPRGVAALGVAVISGIAGVVFLLVIQPHAHGGDPHWSERFFAWDAHTAPMPVATSALLRAGFVLLAFAPLLFLPFRTPAILVAVLPLAEVLGSSSPKTLTIGEHYAGAWIGYVFYAFACTVQQFYANDPTRVRKLLYWCIALCAIEFVVADPLHPGTMLLHYAKRDAALDGFLVTLPTQIDVATQEEAYTHLAAGDPNATLLPEDAGVPLRATYVLIDRDYPDSPRLQEYGAAFEQLVTSGEYGLVTRDGGIELYQRRANRGGSRAQTGKNQA